MTNDNIVLSWIKAKVFADIQPMIMPYTIAYEAWRMLQVNISSIDKNHVQALQDEMGTLKKISSLTMKEYMLKFMSFKNSLIVASYTMSNEKVIEYINS